MSVKNGYDDDTKGVKGAKGVDGVDGITRIVYQDKTANIKWQPWMMVFYGGDTGK